MENKVCSKCGAEMPNDAKFCTKCGQSFERTTPKNQTNKQKLNKKSLYALLAVFAALFLIIFGAMFFSEYSERREAQIAREKFVQDSIKRAELAAEKARLAEEEKKKKAEEARIEEEKKAAQFLNQSSLEKLIKLIENVENEKYAQECGLSLIYEDGEVGADGGMMELVYGRKVEKGSKKSDDLGYTLNSTSDHAYYFKYCEFGSSYAELGFKNQDDANHFFEKAKNYGLLKCQDDYFIPKKKLPGGKVVEVENLDWEGDYAPKYIISKPRNQDGFYVLRIGLDF